MTLEQWRADVAKRRKEIDAFVAKLNANAVRYEDLSSEERERYDRFQARVDDEQLTNSVLAKRKANSGA